MVSFASAMKPTLLLSLTTYVFVGQRSSSGVLAHGFHNGVLSEPSNATVGSFALRITTKPGDAVDLNSSSLW